MAGATVLYDDGKFDIADPFRRPSAFFSTIFGPVGNLKDKLNTLFLKNKVLKTSIPNIFLQKEQSTLNQLADYGFSSKMIERFYKPFFAGIFLEDDLTTSQRMFNFVMKMFSEGEAALPAFGMEEIPKQLVAMLKENTIVYNTKVSKIDANKIITESGIIYETDTVLIATEATGFAKDYIPSKKTKSHQVTNVYFQAIVAPTKKAVVILNASKNKKWVNNLTVMTNVSKNYAPEGKVLISVSLNGIQTVDDITLATNMQNELSQWYGNQVMDWKMLKVYRIKYALPNQETVKNDCSNSDIQIADNLFICGDHLLNGSINAAMKTGRVAAELISTIKK